MLLPAPANTAPADILLDLLLIILELTTHIIGTST